MSGLPPAFTIRTRLARRVLSSGGLTIRTRLARRVLSSGALPLALVALTGPSLTMNPPGKSKLWVAMHWLVAISPFVLVVALSIWGYDKYFWIPFAAGILCPVGAALVGLQVKRDRARMKAR